MRIENSLQQKKILFFCPAFFGYEHKMKDAMIEMGAEVDFFDERSVDKSYEKALLKILPAVFHKKTERYYFEILDTIKSNHYDYVFFVKCDMPTKKVLSVYKQTFPKAKFCLYLYDSVSNIPGAENKFKHFDRITTFDRQDSIHKGIGFRPLFYCKEYQSNKVNENYLYDLCFIGTIHSDRYKILREIEKQATQLGLKMYCYPFLQSKFVYYFYKLTKKEYRKTSISDFKFEKISSQNIADIVQKTRLVVDIQHPKQTGLTMRTIEMIGMNKKIMTTNTDIVNYDFYNDYNVHVIDRNDIKVNKDKLQNDYMALDTEVYNSYSIYSWALDVLGENR